MSKIILSVEDDSVMLLTLYNLIQVPCTYVFARNLGQAKHMISGTIPDLILLDQELEDGNGLDLLEWLRADPDTADVPVIMLSGQGDDAGFVAKALTAGAVAVLSKNVGSKSLNECLTEHLE